MSADLHELIQRYMAGLATPEEAEQLQGLLKQDDAAARLYLRYANLDVALESHAASQAAVREMSLRLAPSTSRSAFRWRAAGLVAAAAAVVLIGCAVFWWPGASTPMPGAAATIVSADQARIAGVEGELIPGRNLQLQGLSVESGRLEIELASGVRLELSAPLEGEFRNDMWLRLDSGSVNADVGEHGKGFTIETAAGQIVDLGTRFGVQADRSGESRVAVFSGSVEVYSRQPSASGGPVTLTEGMAVRFSAQVGLRNWRQVALAAKEAGFAQAHYTGIVERVHDNCGDEELEPFYGVVQKGMAPGALAFTDKPNPRWAPRPGDTVPACLLGADLIRTYHQFRLKRDYELTVTLTEPAEVYVLIKADSRSPDFLPEKFTNTGESIIVGPFHEAIANWPGAFQGEEGRPYFKFAVWKADAPPGEFKFGPARSSGYQLMYGIAIQPKKVSAP